MARDGETAIWMAGVAVVVVRIAFFVSKPHEAERGAANQLLALGKRVENEEEREGEKRYRQHGGTLCPLPRPFFFFYSKMITKDSCLDPFLVCSFVFFRGGRLTSGCMSFCATVSPFGWR